MVFCGLLQGDKIIISTNAVSAYQHRNANTTDSKQHLWNKGERRLIIQADIEIELFYDGTCHVQLITSFITPMPTLPERNLYLLPRPVWKLEPQGKSHARDMILGYHDCRTYRACFLIAKEALGSRRLDQLANWLKDGRCKWPGVYCGTQYRRCILRPFYRCRCHQLHREVSLTSAGELWSQPRKIVPFQNLDEELGVTKRYSSLRRLNLSSRGPIGHWFLTYIKVLRVLTRVSARFETNISSGIRGSGEDHWRSVRLIKSSLEAKIVERRPIVRCSKAIERDGCFRQVNNLAVIATRFVFAMRTCDLSLTPEKMQAWEQ